MQEESHELGALIFELLFQEFLRIFVFVWSYKLLFHTIYIF
jgi:hypothetical protein